MGYSLCSMASFLLALSGPVDEAIFRDTYSWLVEEIVKGGLCCSVPINEVFWKKAFKERGLEKVWLEKKICNHFNLLYQKRPLVLDAIWITLHILVLCPGSFTQQMMISKGFFKLFYCSCHIIWRVLKCSSIPVYRLESFNCN